MTLAVVFYEKPGCISNARQKAVLRGLGHRVTERNLLTEPWTAARLRPFFGELPVSDWFNPSAPRIRDGELCPETLDAETALELMLADPLLIRRPLIETGFGRGCGFSAGPLLAALGVELEPGQDLQACSKPVDAESCPSPLETQP